MLGSFANLLWLYGIWFIVRCHLEMQITRVFWNKDWNGMRWAAQFLQSFSVIWQILPFGYFLTLKEIHNRIIMVPVLLLATLSSLEFIIARRWELRRRQSVPTTALPLFQFLRMRQWRMTDIYLTVPYVLIGLLVSHVGSWQPSAYPTLLFYGILLYMIYNARRWRTRMPQGIVPLEHAPLRWEIEDIAHEFKRTPNQILVRLRKPVQFSPEISVFAVDGQIGWAKETLLIPAENLHTLNPGSYTAALSYAWAENRELSISGYNHSAVTVFILRVYGFLILFGLSFVATTLVVWRIAGVPYYLIVLLALILDTAIVSWLISYAGSRAHKAAYRVWVSADDRTQRTLADYVSAVAEHRAFTKGINDAELVLHQMRLDTGLKRFLKGQTPAELHDLLCHAREHLITNTFLSPQLR